MNINRKTLLMLILMLLGFTFVYVGFTISLLGFLATIDMWLLIIIVVYDHYRAQKEWKQKNKI